MDGTVATILLFQILTFVLYFLDRYMKFKGINVDRYRYSQEITNSINLIKKLKPLFNTIVGDDTMDMIENVVGLDSDDL